MSSKTYDNGKSAAYVTLVDGDGVAVDSGASTAGSLGTAPPSLDNDGQSFTQVQTAAGANGEEISGATAFTAGATIEIVGLDCIVYVGADEAGSETLTVGSPAGVPFRFTLGAAATTFWLCTSAAGGTVVGHQVS